MPYWRNRRLIRGLPRVEAEALGKGGGEGRAREWCHRVLLECSIKSSSIGKVCAGERRWQGIHRKIVDEDMRRSITERGALRSEHSQQGVISGRGEYIRLRS